MYLSTQSGVRLTGVKVHSKRTSREQADTGIRPVDVALPFLVVNNKVFTYFCSLLVLAILFL